MIAESKPDDDTPRCKQCGGELALVVTSQPNYQDEPPRLVCLADWNHHQPSGDEYLDKHLSTIIGSKPQPISYTYATLRQRRWEKKHAQAWFQREGTTEDGRRLIEAQYLPSLASIAHAAGTDAGNRSCRRSQRKGWNERDYNAAVAAYNSVAPAPVRCRFCNSENVLITKSNVAGYVGVHCADCGRHSMAEIEKVA